MSSEVTKTVLVSTNRGIIPFSVGYLARTLLAIGISEDSAYQESRQIAKLVQNRDKSKFTADEIMNISAEWFKKVDDEKSKRIEIVKNDLEELRPLVILIGGVTGIGKSTIARLFAVRMGIKSLLGTDLIREVMRVTLSPDLMPTLHTSSYVAHQRLNTSFLPALSKNIIGFEQQARSVVIGIEAAIEQAIKDDEIIVIEGVHLTPGLLSKNIIENSRVILMQLVLEDEEIHHSRLKIRESKVSVRGTSYINHFNEIREIQEYLKKQAQDNNIPIISMESDEKGLLEMINLVWRKVLDENHQ